MNAAANNCSDCAFYRVKAEIGTGLPQDETGICDNPSVDGRLRLRCIRCSTVDNLCRVLTTERDEARALAGGS